ncbi:MAG: HD-GYP domain-containing protein [Clostridiales bacterium]|nr:HD-GYP domain-containing protein [Clostridiales bacterium]
MNKTQLALLGESHGVEVMLQTIKDNAFVMLTPAEDASVAEYVYIIDGEITLESDNSVVKLNKNDFFSFSNINKTVILKCNAAPVTLLYITSKPTFKHVKMYVSNLDELIKKVDEKDHYTQKHCENVMDYAVAISRVMKCSTSIIEKLALSALFHDVGKCYIPDEILQKPGKLTPEEFKAIYKHPIHSKELVEPSFGEEIANIVLCHHERMNGSGYPHGIYGDQIPLESRIIAVADSFDAMTTKRPYNSPKNFKEAVEELLGLPDLYDIRVVKALKKLVDSGEIYKVCGNKVNILSSEEKEVDKK